MASCLQNRRLGIYLNRYLDSICSEDTGPSFSSEHAIDTAPDPCATDESLVSPRSLFDGLYGETIRWRRDVTRDIGVEAHRLWRGGNMVDVFV